MKTRNLLLVLILVLGFSMTAVQAQNASPQEKPVITTEADIPRYTYKLSTETASELLTNDEAFNEVATQVQSDIEALLNDYTIKDKATLRRLYGTLENLALLREDYKAALEYSAKIQKHEEKPAERLTSGLLTKAVVAAERASGDEEVFRKNYSAAVNELSWNVVQDLIEEQKGRLEMGGPNFLTGMVQSQFDPGAEKAGSISSKVAHEIIGMRTIIDIEYPYKDETIAVLQNYIGANRVEKPNIWSKRNVSLDNESNLSPVVIGVWDSGVDPSVFKDKMFVNKVEKPNGKDDDGNGFVDDIHGIAYTEWGAEKSSSMLYPLNDSQLAMWPEMGDLMIGMTDVRSGLDTPEAQKLKQKMAEMSPSEINSFMDKVSTLSTYGHGTGVASHVATGNPVAQILIVRGTVPPQSNIAPLLKDNAQTWITSFKESVAYLKQQNARVVNMSWSISTQFIEREYEKNGIGRNAEERNTMANEIFDYVVKSMKETMQNTPNILFVIAAGNSNDDTEFVRFAPSSIGLSNAINVGAVDQAGDPTDFSSYGKNVQFYANGFEVENSYVPGGRKAAMSGASLSTPQVANLAGKLFALDPSLTPEEVIDLILEGADKNEEGLRLIHPKRSVELLKEQM